MSCVELASYTRLDLDVVSAEGDELVLAGGERVLDLYGGHCVNTLGAGDAALGARLATQWRDLSFATNLLALDVRAEFLAAFGATLPTGKDDWHVFLSNSGAEANENALKAALAATGRGAVVAFEGAFHGRTAAASAVTDTKQLGFPVAPFEVRRLAFEDFEATRSAVDGEVGAVILEPVQSLAGVVEPSAEYLYFLRARCDEVGALLVFDEVQTGNGRLGSPWAAQELGVIPDAFSTAKGAAAGLPIGITALSGVLAERVASAGGLALFGSTFGGGPLPLAAATVVSRRIASGELLDHVRAASRALVAAGLHGPVRRVRGRGLLLGLELEDGVSAGVVQRGLLAEGVLVGTSKDPRVLRVNPALTFAPEEAARLAGALERLEVCA